MAYLVPFYYITLDGDDPCTWAPFGTTTISDLERATRGQVMISDFSDEKKFSVAVLCKNYSAVADQAISQSVGCLVSADHLKPAQAKQFERQFHSFSNRLYALNKEVLQKLGFELLVIAQDDPSEQTISQAKQLKVRLIRMGVSESSIRVDIIRDQARLNEIARIRLLNIADSVAAASLPAIPAIKS
jgi:hypothetical protein